MNDCTHENGVTGARVPLVGRRFRRDVEIGPTENDAEDLVPGTARVDNVIAERGQLGVHLVNLVHADDDLRSFFGRRLLGGDGRVVDVIRGDDAPVDPALPPSNV